MEGITRREMVAGTSVIAAAGIVSAAPAAAQSGKKFDINTSFAGFMKDIGASAADGGGKVTFTGQDPIIRSHFRVGAAMAHPAMGAAVGAAAIWRDRTGQSQDLTLDLREAVYNVNPLIGAILLMAQRDGTVPAADAIPRDFVMPSNNGLLVQAPVGFGNPMTFVPFETKDNRFFNITGAYPHLNERALRAIRSMPGGDNIKKAIKGMTGLEIEEELVKVNGVGVMHRSTEEWLAHPEGKVLANTPLIEIIKIADGPAVPWSGNPSQPLSGLKVMSNSHVIAGTCSSRTLAEYGAEVLHIARDQAFEHEAFVIDVNVGMRSAFVDLRNPEQNKRMKALIPDADVFVENYRVGTLDRLGFGAEELASGHKGLIYLSCNPNSVNGPWAKRGGFDMEGLSCSGFTIGEGGNTGMPRFPPTLVMNDYIAGYLGACGVIQALRRRAREGGSYHVRVSLTRAAMWYASLGSFPNTDFDLSGPDNRMISPEILVANTPYGEIRRLGPQVKLSKTPGKWRTPLVAVRGGDTVSWA